MAERPNPSTESLFIPFILTFLPLTHHAKEVQPFGNNADLPVSSRPVALYMATPDRRGQDLRLPKRILIKAAHLCRSGLPVIYVFLLCIRDRPLGAYNETYCEVKIEICSFIAVSEAQAAPLSDRPPSNPGFPLPAHVLFACSTRIRVHPDPNGPNR
jgi:hypothetical protein